jgi:predicted metal-dependent enzyme (double-stranded beta helix superfamily)
MPLPSLPARDLHPRELAALVDELAEHPELWRHRLTQPRREREYCSMHRDDHVDVWLIAWTDGADTGWHDHDISHGAFRVLEGELVESSPRIGGDPVTRRLAAGQTVSFGPDHIHRLSGLRARSLSIHAYSPPLWRLGQYSIDADGVLRRVSVSYAEELRPLEPLAS